MSPHDHHAEAEPDRGSPRSGEGAGQPQPGSQQTDLPDPQRQAGTGPLPDDLQSLAQVLSSTGSTAWLEEHGPSGIKVWADDASYSRVLGLSPAKLRAKATDWLRAVDPVDRISLSELANQPGGFDVTARSLGGDERLRLSRHNWRKNESRRLRLMMVQRLPAPPTENAAPEPERAPQQALSVDHLELLLQGSGRGISLLDKDLRIQRCNLAFAARLGRSPASLVGENWFDLIDPEDRRMVATGLAEARKEDRWATIGKRLEHRFLRGGSPPVWVRTDTSRVTLPGAEDTSFLMVSVDISGQRHAAELFDRQQRRQEAIAELARIALTLHDIDTVADHAVSLISEALGMDSASLFQLDPEQPGRLVLRAAQGWPLGRSSAQVVQLTHDNPLSWHLANPTGEVVEPLQQDGFHAPSDAMALLGRPTSLSIVVGSRDRPFGVLAVHGHTQQRFRRSDSAVLQAFGSILAAAVDREHQSDTLRHSEDRLEVSMQSAGLGMWEWHAEDDQIYMEERAARLMGLDDADPGSNPRTGMAATEWLGRFHPGDRDRLEAMLRGVADDQAKGESLEVRVRGGQPVGASTGSGETDPKAWGGSGGWRWLLVAGRGQHGSTIGTHGRFLGVLMDVGARKTLEEQLHQSQKMEGLGRLAGGVAHDFNNLLTAVLGHAEVARLQLPADHPLQQDVTAILDAGNRAAGLTNQLLAFARRQESDPRYLCLGTLLEDMQPLLRSLLNDDIRLEFEIGAELPPAKIDPVQMEQVVVNLAVNAADAMPDGGKLTLQLLPEADHKDSRLVLTVRDTGGGIPGHVLPNIFEPFFTTKEPGRGTGLGLSTCYGIATQAGGEMQVDSEEGRGTEFRVVLPAFADQEPAPLGLGKGLQPEHSLSLDPATLLLVEDNDPVRRLARDTLRARGHEVLSAAGGDEAISLASACPDGVDLLISDVIMPGISGPELAEELRRTHPGMPLLYLSGHVGTHMMPEEDPEQQIWFLRKPFTGTGLVRKVSAILRHQREHPGA